MHETAEPRPPAEEWGHSTGLPGWQEAVGKAARSPQWSPAVSSNPLASQDTGTWKEPLALLLPSTLSAPLEMVGNLQLLENCLLTLISYF